jgi:hypothetical protein
MMYRHAFGSALVASVLFFTSFLPNSYAQSGTGDGEFEFPEGMFTEISGRYVDEEAGIEIEFPQGWSGLGFAGMGIVVPGGINSNYQTSSVDAAMMVMALPRMEFSNAFSSLDALNEQIEENAADQRCHIETYAYTKINSIDGIHIVAECDTTDEEYSNVSMYGIMSENNFILIAFAAKTSDDYNENIAAFEQSINTLKVDHPIPFKTAMAQVLHLTTVNHQVFAKGAKIDLKVETNSEVSNLAFSESDKRISVRVAGQDGTDGTMIIAVNKVLEGPYTVTIDGQATSNFVVAQDDATGQKSVEISYKHSVHDIVITGTNVVPEFPPAVIASILGIIGIIAVLSRTELNAREL